MALIEALSEDWDPDRYDDRYRKRLQDVLRRKRKRQKIEAPEQRKEPKPVPDLMAALEKTLADLKAVRLTRGGDGEPSPPRHRAGRQVAIVTPMEDEMRLHGSAKLVVPLPAMTAPRANTWPEAPGM